MPESDLMDEIVKLQRQVSVLTEIVEHLYTLTSSSQRFNDAQENAYQKISKLIEHAKNPDA